MEEVQLVDALMELPLFEDLDFKQISNIYQACEERKIEPGTLLCQPLTIDDRLLILVEGTLRLESADSVKLADLTAFRIIGEMGVLTGQAHASRVVAEEPAIVLELEGAKLEQLLDEDRETGGQMLTNLCKLLYSRVHNMNEDIETLREQVDQFRNRLQIVAPDDPLLGPPE